MSHDHHHHGHGHHHHHHASGNLRVAFFLNFGFTIIELVGGLLTNSIAIMSDAVHDLGDSLSLGFAWWMSRVAERRGDETFSYGYRRFSLLGGLVTSIVLILGSVLILWRAVVRLDDPPMPHAPGMIGLAILGIAVNGIAVLRVRRGSSLTERVVSWHLLEDLLGWVAVLVVSIILLFADLPILDPILSILITSWVLFNVMRNLKSIGLVFLQATPENVSLRRIEEAIRTQPRAVSVHHAHVWSLDGEHHVLSAHVVVDPQTTREEAADLKRNLRGLTDELGVTHMTIEVEWGEDDCSLAHGEETTCCPPEDEASHRRDSAGT